MKKSKTNYSKLFKATLAASIATGAIVAVTPNVAQAELQGFSDVKKGHFFNESVMDLTSRGVINGYSDGTFKPNENISRAQAAKIIALALDLDFENIKDAGLKDVPKSHPNYKHITALVNAGVISGFDDKTYKPNGKITRSQMAKILVLGFDLKEEKYSKLPFSDVNSKQWFANYIQTLYSKNITKGATATTFEPGSNVTRGQFATFIYRSEQTADQENLEIIEIF